MKLYIIIFISFIFYSCIDIIIDEDYYESIYLQRSGWFELYENNQNEKLQFVSDINSSIQIWFSSKEQIEEIAPCILSIQGENNNLSIYRTLNTNDKITIYLNNNLLDIIELESINFNEQTNFYLLSAIMENGEISLYFNNTNILDSPIIWDAPYYNYQIGTSLNQNNDQTNLWYGYIDEIRLWDIPLTEEIIEFHNTYPKKVSASYDSSYLENLIGLWDFKIKTSEEDISYIFQDINDNQMYTILYTLNTTTQNELSVIGR